MATGPRIIVDLFALLRKHKPLREMLAAYQRKFFVDEIGHVLRSLSCFNDAERQRMPKMIWKATWREVKDVLRNEVKAYAG